MVKILNEGINQIVLKEKKESYLFNTLELTSENTISKSLETLYDRTTRKYKTVEKVGKILEIADYTRTYKYLKTYECRYILLQDGYNIKGSLCRTRWCEVCNSIRIGELIQGYIEPLKALEAEDNKRLYFVTLTAKTIEGKQLKKEIRRRLKTFVKVKDQLRKEGILIHGFRKIEVEYNEDTLLFHPHFHVIVQGFSEAVMLRDYWIKSIGTANLGGQDIKDTRANGDDLVEFFKYATKDVIDSEINARASDTIYEALEGFRVFQPLGKLRKVKQPKEAREDKANIDHISPRKEIYRYEHGIMDYTASNGFKLINTAQISPTIEKIKRERKEKRKAEKERAKNIHHEKETR